MESVKISGYPELGEWKDEQVEDFQGSTNTLYDTIMVTHVMQLSKPTEYATSRVNPNVKGNITYSFKAKFSEF